MPAMGLRGLVMARKKCKRMTRHVRNSGEHGRKNLSERTSAGCDHRKIYMTCRRDAQGMAADLFCPQAVVRLVTNGHAPSPQERP